MHNKVKSSLVSFVVILIFLTFSSAQVNLSDQEIILQSEVEGPSAIRTADLDKDGNSDVIAASIHNDKVSWYKNNGKNGFADQKVISDSAVSVSTISICDLTDNGYMDIIANSNNKIIWFKNNNGKFTSQKTVKNSNYGAGNITAADLDGNGTMDILAGSIEDDKIYWYKNDGKGKFEEHSAIALENPGITQIHTTDFDKDGDLDIIISANNKGNIYWVENKGEGEFAESDLITERPQSIVSTQLADLDKDNKTDIIYATVSGNILWSPNKGIDKISDKKIGKVKGTPNSLSIFDVNQDDQMDIILTSSKEGQTIFSWYQNNNRGNSFSKKEEFTTSDEKAVSLQSLDISKNDKPDILAAFYKDNKIAWYKNTGKSFQKGGIITNSNTKPESIQHFDINQDDYMDIIFASREHNNILWYENNGEGKFDAPKMITNMSYGAESVYASDLNDDGLPDIISASRNDQKIVWYENKKNGFSNQKIIEDSIANVKSIYTSDINKNGKPDILAVCDDGKVSWLKNKGEGNFVKKDLITSSNTKNDIIYLAKIQNIEDLNLFYNYSINDKMAWYERLSPGNNDSTSKESGGCKLYQNYPNPFNPITAIKFTLPKRNDIKLSIYNALGFKISEFSKSNVKSGDHTFFIDGSDLKGGFYIYTFETDGNAETSKMLLKK